MHCIYTALPAPRSHTLILGSLPGDTSLRLGQYYAGPRNQFWPIIESVYGQSLGVPYDERIAFLRSKRLALWDVLHSAQREGSLDGAIRDAVPNDFGAFFTRYPSIRSVLLAGGACERAWCKLKFAPAGVRVIAVPSTSAIPGKNVKTLAEKIAIWKDALLRA